MSADWPVVTLKEAGITLIDCDHKTPKAQEEGLPYVGIPQLKDGRIVLDGARLISEEDFHHWRRKAKPTPDDVILSRRCNPGEIAYVPNNLDIALGQNLVLLRSDGEKVYPPFLRWLAQGSNWWQQVNKFINVGAVFDSLKCVDIPKFEFRLPSMDEQKRIAKILGDLDKKIELNRQTNQTLEHMAQATFKSWFVDFEPTRAKAHARAHIAKGIMPTDDVFTNTLNTANDPQADGAQQSLPKNFSKADADQLVERAAMAAISGKRISELENLLAETLEQLKTTAALFPETLVDSELGEIPEGWEVKTLDDVTSTIIDHRGKTPKKLGGDWVDEGYPAVSAKNIKSGRIVRHDTIRFLNDELYSKWMKTEIEKGDILLTSEAPMGEMYFITDEKKYCLSQRLYALRADNGNVTPAYLYLWLQAPVAQADLEGRATGTTVVGIRQVELKKVNVLVPELYLLERFENLIFSMYEQLNVSEKESQELANLRDDLLPKLLSGELKL